MGRYRYGPHQKNRLPPFVPLLIDTLDTPAWRALSHGARSLYVALKRRYNVKNHNNGKIYLSQRQAAAELGSHHNEIARWFRELQHYGFIVKTMPAYLGVDGRGKAPRWQLTELGTGFDYHPTRDFLRWDGQPFRDQKMKSRAVNGARSVQETAHSDVPENQPSNRVSVRDMAHISEPKGVPPFPHRSSLPFTDTDTEADETPKPRMRRKRLDSAT